MKRLQCEMCGSTDMMKQNGVFVCQSCGMKYSVEDAKKMMIDGVVEVTGTVGIDKTNELQNWFILARRAKSSDDANNAFKYYSLIHEQEPINWEAWFYYYYYQLFIDRNVPTPFANEVDDILKAMWSQVNENDRKNTVTEIITMLKKAIILCTKYEDTIIYDEYGKTIEYEDNIGSRNKTTDNKESLDFEFVMFLLLYNVFVSIKGKGDTYTELLTSLSLSALKVARVFSYILSYGEGYKLRYDLGFKIRRRSKIYFLSEDHKERWNDIEMMIINSVDFLISNHVSPQGFGSVYCYCKSEDDKDNDHDLYKGILEENQYSPIFKGQHIWLGSKAILENIKHRIEILYSNCRPWDFKEPEELNRNRINDYNKELTQLVNKARLFQKDFDSPNYYEQHPLPSADVFLKEITKKLENLNNNYETGFHLKDTSQSQYHYPQIDSKTLRYERLKTKIDKYNKNYEIEYNCLLEEAKKIDPQFTYPNILTTNPIVIEHFCDNPTLTEGCAGFIVYLTVGVISCLIALFLIV